jgi:SulP family sulfate permease
LFNISNYSSKNIKHDIHSGLVVAVALVPEAIAFSFIADLSPIVGLYTAFILGLITAIIGGKPGMISGATGSVAVVLVALSLQASTMLSAQGLSGNDLAFGVLQYITLTAVMAGLLQVLAGVFKIGKFIRLVPQPAMFGFVNGLAIIIALSQFKFFEGQGSEMYLLVISTMLIMYFLPKYTMAIPGGVIASVGLSLFVFYGSINTITVGHLTDLSQFQGHLPSFHIPNTILNVEALMIVLPYAVIVALVGLIESLLTLSVLDEMSGTRGSGNKECIALGSGNIACGLFGGMPGCAMIGQSIINYTSGGLGRLSGITAAVSLMLLVATLTDLLNIIPVAVLVGIMFMVSIGTFEWSSASHIKHMPRSDAFVISALVFAWKHARIFSKTTVEADGTKVYELDGPLFFGSVTSFMDTFTIDQDPTLVVINFEKARVMDSSGIEAIDSITKKNEEAGKNLTLRHLSKDCMTLMKNAGPHCTFEENDPTYKVAVNY